MSLLLAPDMKISVQDCIFRMHVAAKIAEVPPYLIVNNRIRGVLPSTTDPDMPKASLTSSDVLKLCLLVQIKDAGRISLEQALQLADRALPSLTWFLTSLHPETILTKGFEIRTAAAIASYEGDDRFARACAGSRLGDAASRYLVRLDRGDYQLINEVPDDPCITRSVIDLKVLASQIAELSDYAYFFLARKEIRDED